MSVWTKYKSGPANGGVFSKAADECEGGRSLTICNILVTAFPGDTNAQLGL